MRNRYTTIGKILLTFAVFISSFQLATAQQEPGKKGYQKVKDDPNGRLKYETNMLKDPRTGKIPEGIHRKELEYVYSPKAKLQQQYNKGNKYAKSTTALPGTAKWQKRGPYNVGGRTRALAIDINNENLILAGGVSGGMWRSDDRGASWTKVTGASQHHSVTAVAQDPQNPNTWYYATGEGRGNSASASFSAIYAGSGVYKSTDNGLTWVQLASTASLETENDNPFRIAWNIKVHPTTGDVYLATGRAYSTSTGAIWRSTDGGTTWNKVIDGGNAVYTDIEIAANGLMYATIASSSTTAFKGIYRSTNGTDWTDITPASMPVSYARVVLDIAASNTNVAYFFAATPGAGVSGHSFFKYTYTAGVGNGDGTTGNGGAWENRSSNLPAYGGNVGNLAQANYNQFVRVKLDDENVVFIGSTNLYRSLDAFATDTQNAWVGGYSTLNNVSTYPNHHPDNHALAFFPSDPTKMISGHDGGVSYTDDNLATNPTHPVAWTSLNNGYYTTQIYGMHIDPETAGDNRLIIGLQDNGKWTVNDKSSTAIWGEEVGGGDGAFVAITPGKDTRYTSTQFGKVARVEGADPQNPTAAVHVFPAGASGQLFVHPFALDPSDYKIMYYPGGGNLWRHNDVESINSGWNFGGTADPGWTNLTNAAVPGSITAVAASKANPSYRVYYGTSTGSVYRLDSANTGNPVAVQVLAGQGGYLSCVAIDPTNADRVFAVFSNYGIQSIFYSADGGANWTDVGGNLEENPDGSGNGPSVRWLDIHVNSSGTTTYYAGTSTGLYATNAISSATNWVQEGANTIGNTVVTRVRSRGIDGLVAVGTHGTGVYSANVGQSDNVAIAYFSPMIGEPGEQVTINGIRFDANAANNTVKINGMVANVVSASANNLVVTVPNGATSGKITVEVNGQTATSAKDFTVILPIAKYPYTESFEEGTSNWKLAVDGNDFNWAVGQGSTPSSETGPNKASEGLYYMYVESSDPNYPEKKAALQSRSFDLTSLSEPTLVFAYHMLGDTTMGTLQVEVTADGVTWDSTWSATGNQGEQWKTAVLDLSAYKSANTRIRFVGTTVDGWKSDMAIDALTITEKGAPAITGFTPLSGFEGQVVTVSGVNFGTTTATNLVTFNGTAAQLTAATDSLLTTSLPATATTGKISVTVAGQTAVSMSNFNVIEVINTFPYKESFEDAALGNWEQSFDDDLNWDRNQGGTPSFNTGPGQASDGAYYMYVEASGDGYPSKNALLSSPPVNARTLTSPTLTFDYHMYGANMGSLVLEISKDNGATWSPIWSKSGDQGDVWKTDSVSLKAHKYATMMFRFSGTTGATWLSDMSIDNINIKEGFVTELPIADFKVSRTEIWEGESLKFNNESQNAVTYLWKISGGEAATSTEKSPTVKYNKAGSYHTILIAYNSLGQTSVKTVAITVKARPKLPIADFKVSNTTIYEGEGLKFNNESRHASRYEWKFSGGNITSSTETSPYISYNKAGTYHATLIAYNANNQSDSKILEIKVVKRGASNVTGSVVDVKIYSNTGALMRTTRIAEDAQPTESLKGLQKGLYFVHVYTAQGVKKYQIVKQD
ncbi:IPT/TIG domain-containing protein [Microscilla marina]|uniref:IPT/TIG domain-containing protein n=1 Tax=Microscilla marina TaxID=1027 RepID=UPI0006A6AE47|nr:IPT/TIG domain-containing protein [Microscilla marina]